MKTKPPLKLVLITLAILLLTACASGADAAASVNPVTSTESVASLTNKDETQSTEITQPNEADESNDGTTRPIGWDEDTHSKEAEPDYEVVFPQDEVNRLDITITPDNWQAMLDDMTEMYGAFGANPRGGPGAAQGGPQEQNHQTPGMKPPVGETPPQNGGQAPDRGNRPAGGGGMMEGDEHNPIWVPVTIEFEDDIWKNVGLRFKGNSSLFSSWGGGNYKIPLKLDFDEFEDEYPEIDDQRFYGFKQLSLASNFNDSSFLHEKVAADLFREAGVPAAQTAFYQVYIDYGEGPVYFGLYTMVEVIDDTVIETQFEEDDGNVYKPSGRGATFAAGSFNEDSFDKETNQDEADYSDILGLYEALHAETRTNDPETWRTNLEAVFDVDGFLNWLAVNTVIQNWDTYGLMQHNYYLYQDPTSDQLTWIPWDNNEAFKTGNMRGALSLSLDEVSSDWPLIRYLLDDPIYQDQYTNYIDAFITGPFVPDTISDRFEELHEMIHPYVVGANGEVEGYTHLKSEGAFDIGLRDLMQHTQNRYQAARDYLDSQK